MDTSALCRAITIVAENVSVVMTEKTVPESPGRVGAPAMTATPAAATPIAAQVRARTGSPTSRPSSADTNGTSAWMMRTFATDVSLSAVMNAPDEIAMSTAIARPDRPIARKARISRPCSAAAMNTSSARNANIARPASWEGRLMCS